MKAAIPSSLHGQDAVSFTCAAFGVRHLRVAHGLQTCICYRQPPSAGCRSSVRERATAGHNCSTVGRLRA